MVPVSVPSSKLPPAVDPFKGRVTLLPSAPGIVVVPSGAGSPPDAGTSGSPDSPAELSSETKSGVSARPTAELELGVTPDAPGTPDEGEPAIGAVLTLTVNDPNDCPLLSALSSGPVELGRSRFGQFRGHPTENLGCATVLDVHLACHGEQLDLVAGELYSPVSLPFAGRVNITDFIATERFPRATWRTPLRLSVPVALAKFHFPELSGRAKAELRESPAAAR